MVVSSTGPISADRGTRYELKEASANGERYTIGFDRAGTRERFDVGYTAESDEWVTSESDSPHMRFKVVR